LHPFFIAVLAAAFIAAFITIPARTPASPDDGAPERTFSVVSLNLAKESDPEEIVRAIQGAPRLHNADLFLFQEVVHTQGRPSVADEAARKLGYFSAFAASAPGIYDQGLSLVSRHPISRVEVKPLKSCDLAFRNRSRFAISAIVHTPWGDLGVWNVHLDTRVNAAERLEQLRPVIDDAAQRRGPLLIGGDFNTNDLYWVRNVVPLPGGPSHSSVIRAAMRRHGFETGLRPGLRTYPMFSRHLDWMFTRGLVPVTSSVEPAAFSDHNAIWLRVQI
jgi:endonuclease/exonuclease/phosphatase (EEP) superfamily protein YafD